MADFTDPNFYLNPPPQNKQSTNTTNPKNKSTTYSRTPSDPVDALLDAFSSVPSNTNSTNNHKKAQSPSPPQSANVIQQQPSRTTTTTASSGNNTIGGPKKATTKGQLQEQLNLLVNSSAGVSDWCNYNNFDPIIAQRIGHLSGHDLLSSSKTQIMSLLASPKYGLLVWTRLKHLVDAISEQTITIPLTGGNEADDDDHHHMTHHSSSTKNKNHSRSHHRSSEVALPYQQHSYDSNVNNSSYTPQFSSLNDQHDNDNDNNNNTRPFQHLPNNSNAYELTRTDHSFHQGDYGSGSGGSFKSTRTTGNHNNNNNNIKNYNTNENNHSNYNTNDNNNYNSYGTNDDYDVNINNDNNHNNRNTPYMEHHSNDYARAHKVGSGSFDEFFDFNNLSMANLTQYFTWNNITETLTASYNEWCNMVGEKYQHMNQKDRFLELCTRLKQMEQEQRREDVEVGYEQSPSSGHNNRPQRYHNNNDEDHIAGINNDDETMGFQHSSYQSMSYQSGDDDSSTQSHQPFQQQSPSQEQKLSSSMQSIRSQQSFNNNNTNTKMSRRDKNNGYEEYDGDNNNTHSQSSPNHNNHHNPSNHQHQQCEFGLCERLTDVKCCMPNCQLALCFSHIQKDIVSGYYYCPTCYKDTYTYALMNNQLTNGCNIQ